jgi:tetratricopeptide (TPR) repeat protein
VRALPAALLGLLLVVSSWWDSAFDLRYWAPLTILALGLLLAQLLTASLSIPRRGPLAIATAGIWCFAGFVLLTAAWSQSPAAAWEEAARSVFYAAVWTLAVSAAADHGWRKRLGAGLVIGVSVVALVTLIGLVADAHGFFLAGRLDSPVGYRNGTAAFFAFAAWPLIGFAARRGGGSGARAGAFAAATLGLSLAFLTQSRGVLIGLALGGVVSLVIGPDRLRRAWLAVGAVGAVAVFSGPLLTPYDAFINNNAVVTSSDFGSAATAVLFLTTASFVLGLFVFVFDNGLRSPSLDRGIRLVASVGLVVLACGAGVVGLAKVGDPIDYANTKLDEFKEVEPAATGSTRLGSVGGQRSDLWRVAWDQFKERPLAGAGAGSYQFAYFRDRETDRNLSDAHSLPLRLLADTGLIGTALFAVWLIAAAVGVAQRARERIDEDRVWIAGLAAAATTVLAQCLTDWLWLLPGLVGLSFLALGFAAGGDENREQKVPGSAWSPGRLAFGGLLAAATISVIFLFFGDLYVRKARVEAYRSPGAELSAAKTATFFNPVSVTPLYLQASALESEGERGEAKRKLEDALALEPNNFVIFGLLGDLEVRAANQAAARNYYRKALALNPIDIGLRKLSHGTE